MKIIIDEFTNLPVSKQRKWALRRAKEGKCIICGIDSSGKLRCEYHLKQDGFYKKIRLLNKYREEMII